MEVAMHASLDFQAWRDALVSSFATLADSAATYLPRVAAAIVVLGAGWLVSALVATIAKWILRRLGVDRAAARLRLADVLRHAGIAAPISEILGQFIFFVLLLAFARAAVDFLGLVSVASAIQSLVAFLPSLVAAGFIVLFGALLGRFAANLVRSGAATARLPQAARLGALTHGMFLLVATVMALERIGIETDILVTVVTAVIAAAAITMGAAFALGARPLVTHILAGHFLRQSLPTDRVVELGGLRGVVERIGPIDTVLRGEDHSWSIPNARLLDEVVTR
jgi:hypothetical protein